MQILLSLSIALLAGLMLSRVAKLLQLPAVTAYLVTGILIGPYCLGAFGVKGLGFISMADIKSYSLLCDIALGFIAFSIGNEFRLSQLKKIGKQATVVGIFQAVTATLLVDGVLILLHLLMPDKLPLPATLILGAIASATAPAATLMVVKQYKAKGPLTDILLPVVALDDAVGLVLFAISFGVAKAILSGVIDIVSILVNPLLEIILSLGLGAVMGFLFSWCERFFHSRSKRLAVSVGFVMLTIGLSMLKFEFGKVHIGFSSLLVCMMLGTIFCNICDFSEELMDRVDRWTAPLFVLFFVLSGAELELSVFTDIMIVLIGLVYPHPFHRQIFGRIFKRKMDEMRRQYRQIFRRNPFAPSGRRAGYGNQERGFRTSDYREHHAFRRAYLRARRTYAHENCVVKSRRHQPRGQDERAPRTREKESATSYGKYAKLTNLPYTKTGFGRYAQIPFYFTLLRLTN